MNKTFSQWIANWASNFESSDSSEGVVQARLALVDTLACILAGFDEPQGKRVLQGMLDGDEDGPVTPVGGGAGLTLGAAAMVNGVRAHALDFDDYEGAASTHPSAVLLGALLAVAQRDSLSILEISTAWIVGYETIVRLGEALGYGHYLNGWHATSTLGCIGAAAAVAKAMNLDANGIEAAMTIATSSSAGLKLQFGSDTKALHAGLAARAGVQAALFAKAGVSGASNIWDREFGFVSTYGDTESNPLDGLIADDRLGQGVIDFPVMRKPWPSCAYTHRSIEAAIQIHNEIKPAIDDIAKVVVSMPEPFAHVAGVLRPTNPSEARFSAVYCVAKALLKGSINPSDFATVALTNPEVMKLLPKVELVYLPAPHGLVDMSPDAPDTVEVTLLDGQVRSRTISQVSGGVDRPMTEEAIREKFISCGGVDEAVDHLLNGDSALPIT